MSNDVAIRVEGLGKRYALGQTLDLKRTFRETLSNLPAFLGGKAARVSRTFLKNARHGNVQSADTDTPAGTFWALQDVSFEVKSGEAVGVIGRNGAGKSTLLKILSRITFPTKGRATIHGRLASLLEVGTGFHGELTGRENIYLNGAILGMRKTEIDAKFDAITAFAEVDQFLDTPVKRYSSGMYVRLAFAVAAHLEPEILLVDEVLAVGDLSFQRKCLGKMEDVAKGGRTVLFVSHNLASISQLCDRCLLLKSGQLVRSGATNEVIQEYISEARSTQADVTLEPPPHSRVGFKRIWITDKHDAITSEIDVLDPFYINMTVQVRELVDNVDIGVIFYTIRDTPVTFSKLSNIRNGKELVRLEPGVYSCRVEIPARFLTPDDYKITVGAYIPNVQHEDSRQHVLDFSVLETGSQVHQFKNAWQLGCVLNDFTWQYERE